MSERSPTEPRLHQERSQGIAWELWFGFFGGIFAWGLRFGIGYMLVQPACVDGVTPLIHLTTIVFAVIAAAATWSAWKAWRRTGESFSTTVDGYSTRVAFMALFGIVMSAGSFFAIVLEGSMALIIDPCQR